MKREDFAGDMVVWTVTWFGLGFVLGTTILGLLS